MVIFHIYVEIPEGSKGEIIPFDGGKIIWSVFFLFFIFIIMI